MHILITGGAGFIGSNLCDYLLSKSHSITVVDNLSTGKISNLATVINNITFYQESIEYFNFSKCAYIDVIMHLAAQPSVPLSITDFYDSSSSNLLGTINVIEYCRTNQTPLVYASSSAVYGDLKLGNDESDRIDLLSPYATDKYVMELYTKTAYKLYQLSSIGLRFFNVYGPRQDPSSPYSGVISIFADRMLNEQEIIMNGGHQTRDFVYVGDVVNTIYRAIILASKNTVCEVCNVLTGRSVTIDHLADQMMDVVGVEVNKVYRDLPFGDPEQSDGTVENMVRLFSIKIEQLIELEAGLKKTVEYIRNEH